MSFVKCNLRLWSKDRCEVEGKEKFWREKFWREMGATVMRIPDGEKLFLGGDLNVWVDEGNEGDEAVLGRYVYGLENDGGQRIIDFVKSIPLPAPRDRHSRVKEEPHRLTTYF